MTEMTRKEMEKIIKECHLTNGKFHQQPPLYFEAKGYLLASDRYREREKVLVEALEKISMKNGLQYSDFFRIAEEALSALRRMEE